MTMERDELTSRDYERQAEATRNRLADTLDELHDRLTPGHMLDEVLSYARGGGVTFLRALSNAARENPMAALLIGAGCAMFMAEKTGISRRFAASGDGGAARSASDAATATGQSMRSAMGTAADTASATGRSMRSAAGSAADAVKERAGSLSEGMRERAASVGDTVSEAADSLRDRVSGAAASVADTASSVGDRVSNAAGSVRSRVSNTATSMAEAASGAAQQARQGLQDTGARVAQSADQMKQRAAELGETVQDYAAAAGEQIAGTAERAREQATEAARQVKEKATTLIKEQPLLVAAIGLAVGAAIAAALPKSRVEDEFMGETSDAVKDTIGEVASGQYEKAKAVAGSVAEHALSKAKEEGLSPSGAAEAARSLGEKAKRVATEAVESTAEALQDKESKRS